MQFDIMMTCVHEHMDYDLGADPNDNINNWIKLFFIQKDRTDEAYDKNKKHKMFEIHLRSINSKIMNFSIRYDTEINFRREMLRRINKAYFEAYDRNTKLFGCYEDFYKSYPEICKILCQYFGENPMIESKPVGIHKGIYLIDFEVSLHAKANKPQEQVNFDEDIPF